jgi:hypothetical protein
MHVHTIIKRCVINKDLSITLHQRLGHVHKSFKINKIGVPSVYLVFLILLTFKLVWIVLREINQQVKERCQ